MNTTAVVDTHALIWFLEENPLLGKKAEEILMDASSTLVIPVIVLCEFYAYLRKKGELQRYVAIYEDIRTDERFVIRDLTPDLVLKIPATLELHDGLIAATLSDTPQAVLLSKDEKLTEWGGPAVVWR